MLGPSPTSTTATNSRRWLFLVLAIVFVPYVIRFFAMTPRGYTPDGDGFYIYLFARSLAFDFDLDFTNDYAICGDRWNMAARVTGTGHPPNPWYIGPSLLWTPFVFVLRHVLPMEHASETERLGCNGVIPVTIGILAPIFTVITLLIARRIALRFASERATTIAMLVVGFGSPLLVYGSWVWSYSHVWGAFTLTAGALYALRIAERRDRLSDYLLCGFFFGWAGLMRPHHAVFILTPFLLTVFVLVDSARAKKLPVADCLRGLACLGAYLAMTAVRLWSHDYMYGSPWPPTLRSVYLQPAHAHPFLLLFSNRSGFLAYTPLMWLAVIGLWFFVRNRPNRRYAIAIVVPFLLDYWICASPLMWTASATIGARLLTSFSGLFVVWSAMTIDRIIAFVTIDRRRLERFAAAVVLVPTLVFAWNMDDPSEHLETSRIYGGTFTRIIERIDHAIGNPFTFPAPVVFGLRYRTRPSGFGGVADYGHFPHDFDDGHLTGSDRLSFRRVSIDAIYEGAWVTASRGKRLEPGGVGRVIYPLAWPYVTSLEVRLADPPGRRGCRLRVENHLFVEGTWLGTKTLSETSLDVVFPARAGAFDSGINETRFRSNCPLVIDSIRWVDQDTSGQRSILDPAGARESSP